MRAPPAGVAWRVCHWKTIYENNRSRESKDLNWLPIPIHMDGDGYTELLDHPDGAAHYGAWIALVCVAARTKERGTLQRDAGIPHDAATLARISRIGVRYYNEAIPRFVAIGWLDLVEIKRDGLVPQDGAAIPHKTAVIPHNGAPRARAEYTEYTEQKEHTLSARIDFDPTEILQGILKRHPKSDGAQMGIRLLGQVISESVDPQTVAISIDLRHRDYVSGISNPKYVKSLANWVRDRMYMDPPSKNGTEEIDYPK